MALLNNDTPSAPPAPGIKSITGVGNQNQGIAGALANQPQAPSVQEQQQDKQANTSSQVEKSSFTMDPNPYKPTAPPKPPVKPKGPSVKPKVAPKFTETPDPRDSVYWQNVQALEATLGPMGNEMIALQGEQDRADIAFNDDKAQQAEYYRRRRRDLAESRLGTGSMYTGMARREQGENTYGYLADMGRRSMDKANADAARKAAQQDIADRYQAGLRAEEAAGAKRIYDSMNQQAESGIDPVVPVANNGNASIRKQIKGTTKQIKTLRSRMEDAKNPRQKERIQGKIEKLRKRRSKLQGKISG